MINRKIEKNIVENLFKGKVIIIYGEHMIRKKLTLQKNEMVSYLPMSLS